jgi:hypothetical protein
VRVPRVLRLPGAHLAYLGSAYLAGLALLSLQRLALLFAVREQAREVPARVLLRALFMGVRFDTVVSCYLLFLPLVVLTVAAAPEPTMRYAGQLS